MECDIFCQRGLFLHSSCREFLCGEKNDLDEVSKKKCHIISLMVVLFATILLFQKQRPQF